jgi:hypothetical protein
LESSEVDFEKANAGEMARPKSIILDFGHN